MRRAPTYIFNADTTTRRDVAQYLANAGVLDTLNELDYWADREERLWERHWRRNPDGELTQKQIEEAEEIEKNKQAAKTRLLGEMFNQARGMGWEIPASWYPMDDFKPENILRARREKARRPSSEGPTPWRNNPDYPSTTPEAFNDLTIEDITQLLQNQAIILKNIAPTTTCTDSSPFGGRSFVFQYHILQDKNTKLPYWGIPGLYDLRKEKGKKGKGRVKDYYLYDNRGKKRHFGPTSPNNSMDCQPYDRRTYDESLEASPPLRSAVDSGEHPWPIPFIPKSWEDTDENRLDVATVDQPSLKDIDESDNAIPPEEDKMPDGSEPPKPFDFQFGKEKPFEWQELALKRWWEPEALIDIENEYGDPLELWRGGLVEACTGAGKTRFCFEAIKSVLMKDTEDSKTRVSIVVPTIVLLHQWFEEATDWFHEHLPEELVPHISRHGGKSDEPANQVSIWVINTAAEELPVADRQHPNLLKYKKHFLIVDEVHRSTAPTRRQIYNFVGSDIESSKFLYPEYRLGVTATLPKNKAKFELLKRYIGYPLCRYRYADALAKGNISEFVLRYLETSLTDQERLAFEDLSAKIKKLSAVVKRNDKLRKEGKIVMWGTGENRMPLPSWEISEARLPTKGAKETDSPHDKLRRARMIQRLKEERGDPPDKSLLKFFGGARARIYWSAANRLACALDLIRFKVLSEKKKVIVFHKSIDGAVALYNALYLGFNYGNEHPAESVNAGIYHSQNPPGVNDEFLKAFKKDPSEEGSVQCLVSVQSLLEGLDVPSAAVAVCVAADKSQIKALQSLGRVLRKDKNNPIKEYWFISVNTPGAAKVGDGDATKLKGDEFVKFNFESSLKKDGGFVIDTPETIECNTRYPHTSDDVARLHNQCGLMSYDEIRRLAIEKLNFMEEGIITKSKLDEAIIDYNEAVEARAGDDIEMKKREQIEISRPKTAWPDWLRKKFKNLPVYRDPLLEDEDGIPPKLRYY